MADVVLTVAKSLVEGTLTKAQLAIEEEEKLRKKAQRDLVFIAGEFQMMQSFLSVTTKENVQNNIVSTCVTQVRDLAYDVEDCIEFILHLDTKPDWWCRLIPSCMAPARPLDEAVDILEHLKARVQDLSDRNTRYKLIGDNSIPRTVSEIRLPATAGTSDMKQRDLDALTKLITKKDNDFQVISVWASEDEADAVSIIMKAYNDAKIKQKFKCCAWVKQAKAFNLHDFLISLNDEFHQNSSEEKQGETRCAGQLMGAEKLVVEIQKQLNNKKYFIVLEDVSITKEDWEAMKRCLPDCSKGSRVVVLTQQFQVASFCTGYPYIRRFWSDYSHCVFSNEVPLIGRQSEINELIKYHSRAPADDLHVISVWGTAGAGKSALVRMFYHDMIREEKYEQYIWVDVSHPLDLMKFCQSLRLQFASQSLEARNAISMGKSENRSSVGSLEGSDAISSGKSEIRDFVGKYKVLIENQRCFVVIDNLQFTEQWDAVQEILAILSAGSTIIVTTSEERVALHCADKKGLIVNVKGLEFGEAIDLFKNQVRKHGNIPIKAIDNTEVIRTLISKCGGLPKVIVTVAESLAQEFEWQKKATNLMEGKLVSELETRSEFACLRGLFSWMQIYLGSLPEVLKHHVAYLLIFPGDRSIRRRRLLLRWVTEGFSKDNDSYTANENGELLFSKLVELSMIHPPLFTTTTNTRIDSYEVSNIFHEYMVTRPPEENIATAIEIFALRGTCSPTSRRRGRHLVMEESWDRDRIVFENIDFSRLRSLTVFGKWDSFFITESMKVLRVLDLEDASGVTDKDLQNMLKQLRRLKFLSLRGCCEIRYLPSSVGELRQLQVLDVRHTNIVTIPMSITKLKKLQYIRAGTSAPRENPSAPSTVAFKLSELRRCLKLVGVKVMSGIGKLTALHTLGVVNVGVAGGKIILKELGNLTQLRKLGVSGISKKNCKEFRNALLCHSRLESLSVWLHKDNEECLDGMSAETTKVISQPPNKLQSLKLYGPVKNLPRWIEMLNNLKKLNLEMDILSNDDIRVLGNLPHLCILRLRVKPSHQDGEMRFCVLTDDNVEEPCYKKIKVLEIASRSKLLLIIGLEAMQNLEMLTAGCCTAGLLPQFENLKHLSKLKEVCVIGDHDDTLKKILEDQFAAEGINKSILKFWNLEVYLSVRKSTGRNANMGCSFPFLPTTPSSCQ